VAQSETTERDLQLQLDSLFGSEGDGEELVNRSIKGVVERGEKGVNLARGAGAHVIHCTREWAA